MCGICLTSAPTPATRGGENGQNHKGLVTIDRQYKKDAFYAYKAWLSDEPFVHLCGKRFVNHTGDTVRITVYSNQPQVELFANGVFPGGAAGGGSLLPLHGAQSGCDKTGSCGRRPAVTAAPSTMWIPPTSAIACGNRGAILNWFDVTENEGFYSLNDRISDIMKVPEGKQVILDLLAMVGHGRKR